MRTIEDIGTLMDVTGDGNCRYYSYWGSKSKMYRDGDQIWLHLRDPIYDAFYRR